MIRLTREQLGTLRHWLEPERPGPLIAQHVLNTGNGACHADRWPDPRALLAEAGGGNYSLAGDPTALRPADLRGRVKGFVEAPEAFVPLLHAALGDIAEWPRIVLTLDGAPGTSPGSASLDLEAPDPEAPGDGYQVRLFAFALGVAVGALTRRTVAAMAVTLAIYAATRFAVSTWWRPHFRAPIETAIQRDDQLADPSGAWILELFLRDGQGRRLTPEQETEIYNLQNGILDTPFHDLLAPRGLTQHLSYHPADRLIPFELLEAGIFVMLAALLIGLAFWWIQRRTT